MSLPPNTWGSYTDWAEHAILVHILSQHLGTNLFVVSVISSVAEVLAVRCCPNSRDCMKKARALEVVFKETEEMQAVKETGNSTTIIAAINIPYSWKV